MRPVIVIILAAIFIASCGDQKHKETGPEQSLNEKEIEAAVSGIPAYQKNQEANLALFINDNSCMACIQQQFQILEQLNEKFGVEYQVYLNTKSRRAHITFSNSQPIDTIYKIDNQLLASSASPFYFVKESGRIYFPDQSYPQLTLNFLGEVLDLDKMNVEEN